MSGLLDRGRSLVASLLLTLLAAACAPRPAPLLVPADYASWGKTTERRLDYPIPGHEDRLRVIRMNGIGLAAKPTGSAGRERWDFPEGSIIAKEIYPDASPPQGTQPLLVTAMVKAPRDPRAQAGWIWVVKDFSTGKERVFAGNFCVSCHENANESHPYADGNPEGEFRDGVFFVPGRDRAAAAPPQDPEGY